MRIRTGYSFKLAYGKIEEVASRLDEIGWHKQPISDRNSTYAFVRWSKLVKNPVYGVELGVVPDLGEKKPVIDHFSFFAIDSLRALHTAVGMATGNPGRDPSITYESMMRMQDLIKISGERVQLDRIKPQDNLFIGLSPSLPRGLYEEAKRRKFRFIATSDNYYTREEDKELYRVALGFRSNTQTYPMHILSNEEWEKACLRIVDGDKKSLLLAAKNRAEMLTACHAKLDKATLLKPAHSKTLRELCVIGAKKLNINLKNKVYAERLDHELKLIKEKEFEDYFYIIADMVQWAKERMIVGPARGSSCGSLACYLLGITAIDPIPFGLIFERFIDTTRADLPDIDIDFSDTRREMVFEYAEKKYGREHVARLGTVGLFKPRSALAQAGKSLYIPQWQISNVLDGLIERSLGDSRALQTLEDTLAETDAGRRMLNDFPEVKVVARMEGHPQNAGQHAAGIVLTQKPVIDYVAVDSRTKSAMCDKYDAETLNLLKIDALGLTQLSIFERTLQLIGKPDISGYLETLPLDDKESFEVLNKGHYAGIFQFNGAALQSLTNQVKMDKLDDIVAITALARPGPMATGGANLWVKRRIGQADIEYPHPLLKPYLDETLGIVVYQEQVLRIGREIGDMTWEDVTKLRKTMSKSLGKEYFNQFGEVWKKGAMKRKIKKEVADEIWDSLCSMGSWAFNKAHAVAYGLVSYWCCYLKAHHPVEFAAATLDAENDSARQIKLLRELRDEGINYKPIDIKHSIDRWTIAKNGKKKVLVGPLTSVKGIGPATVKEILEARKNGTKLRESVAKKLREADTDIDTLFPVTEAIKRIDLKSLKINSEPWPISDVQCGVKGEFMVIAVASKIAPRDENDAQNVAKRKGKRYSGPTLALNMFVQDDSGEIFAKINRFDYEELGRSIAERGRAGKSLYAIKGTCPPDFRMIRISNIRYIGEIDDKKGVKKNGKGS